MTNPAQYDVYEFNYTEDGETTPCRLIVLEVTDTHVYYRFTDDENTKRCPMAISVWNENKCRRKFIENNGCPHTNGTVYKWHTYPATLEEPSETVGRLYCDECGEEFELGYEPEGMELRWIEDAEYLEDR